MNISELAEHIALAIMNDIVDRQGEKETDIFEWRRIVSKALNAANLFSPVITKRPFRLNVLHNRRNYLEHCADLCAKALVAYVYERETVIESHEQEQEFLKHLAEIISAEITKHLLPT